MQFTKQEQALIKLAASHMAPQMAKKATLQDKLSEYGIGLSKRAAADVGDIRHPAQTPVAIEAAQQKNLQDGATVSRNLQQGIQNRTAQPRRLFPTLWHAESMLTKPRYSRYMKSTIPAVSDNDLYESHIWLNNSDAVSQKQKEIYGRNYAFDEGAGPAMEQERTAKMQEIYGK